MNNCNCVNCKNYEPEVKEESLEDKLKNKLGGVVFCEKEEWKVHVYFDEHMKQLAQIAKEHYLEVFDKATDKCLKNDTVVDRVRQALKNA